MAGCSRRRRAILAGLVIILTIVLPAAAPSAFGANLQWDPSLATNLAGYRIYQCDQPPCQKTSPSVGLLATLGNVTSFNIGTPAVTRYYFVTAYDFDNNESGESNVAAYIAPTSNPGGIQGIAFEDIDLDGQRDPGEPPIAGRTIYLDTNSNGRRDGGEPSAVTDAAGAYQFTSLGPGTYNVAQELPQQWLVTAPASTTHLVNVTSGTVADGKDFGAVALTLDLDHNGLADALSDGALIVRYLYGFTGSMLINGAVDPFGLRRDPAAIAAYLDRAGMSMLDVDGNGNADALSDGTLIIRYLYGFTGESLITGAVDVRGQRTTSEAIITFLNRFLPPSQRTGN